MRVRKGAKQLGGGKVLVKSNSGLTPRQMACPKCKTPIPATTGQNGKPIYKCRCGSSYVSKTM